ncbi:MAG: bacterial transcriptional activator domain-containing protein [Anaerolineales bacterium]
MPSLPTGFPEDYFETLRVYLAEGGAPAGVPDILEAWNAAIPQGASFLHADLTGDGVKETIVAFINPQSETFPPEGALAIFTCRAGDVERFYTFLPGPGFQPSLIGVRDLTGEAPQELVFSEVSCGAHTCMRTVHVWTWTGSDFVEQVSGDFTLPYPDFTLAEGAVLGSSQGFGSVGAGPQRVYTETWSWNGEVLTKTDETVGPANYRYHAFIDGDDALFAEDYDAAFSAYSRVLNDDTLEPWAAAHGAAEERRWLEALAQWRLITVGMHLGNFPDAEARYQDLQTEYAEGTPGHSVALMAQRFWEAYLEAGNVAQACQVAIEAPASEEVLNFLNSFGYANPTYSREELCPFLTP